MTLKYQFKLPDGDWTNGSVRFDKVWPHVRDHLRFHRGEKFTIDGGVHRTLRAVARPLRKKLQHEAHDTVVVVKALKDGFALKVRLHYTPDPVPVQMTAWAKAQIGAGYLLGAEGPSYYDCSGLTKVNTQIHTGITLFHKATVQMHDPRVHSIRLDQAKPMDMIFLHGNWLAVSHVAYLLDKDGPGGSWRVIDAEPSDTTAPAGWFKSMLGRGVQIRPTIGNYYCSTSEIVKVGRLYAVNGRP